MTSRTKGPVILAGLVAAIALTTSTGHTHATYNISGYGSGLGGSTNGADGQPTSGALASWTNGPVADYTGALPVQWYCGLHNAKQVRTIQTGAGASPPSGSLLAQVVTYNGANDPDYPTDLVLAVGGLSWADPSNGGQGWGHGLDYGLIHVTPLDTILAGGPVKLTVTLDDDPSDGVAPQLAYALYAGWDTSTTALRHQTFVTNPTPEATNPLGSTGLRLIDYAVATAPGQVLSRSYDIDPADGGEYTIFIAALGGVAGQYRLTAGLYPDAAVATCAANLATAQASLSTCNTDLATCADELDAATADADGDGVPDGIDTCPKTPAAIPVDLAGCSQAQFCGSFDITTKSGNKECKKADWRNDEPLLSGKTADCLSDRRNTGLCLPKP